MWSLPIHWAIPAGKSRPAVSPVSRPRAGRAWALHVYAICFCLFLRMYLALGLRLSRVAAERLAFMGFVLCMYPIVDDPPPRSSVRMCVRDHERSRRCAVGFVRLTVV